MAAFNSARREALAQGLARGLSLKAASEAAGYRSSTSRTRGRSASAAVKARVEEIKEAARWAGQDDLAWIFAELMRLAKAAGKLETAAGMSAAKGLLAEAARLRERLASPEASADAGGGGWVTPAPVPKLTKAEWLAAFAPRRETANEPE